MTCAALVIHYGCEPFVGRASRWFGGLPAFAQAVGIYLALSIMYLMARDEVVNRAFIYFQF